ncbi:exo-alpha-sialidase [Permianibacter sp. IMCC34836]|uniref:exo-alpha-sialidase n=1 Tax=Permianibacter fluminis TaxID=2738515 RepID=UPI0015517A71|nr:exo-alpha-sialidase [Permianibacter fluminis]NQD38245.1 exo-alpha-sialidase [Permianibacter fluminis]
MSWLEKVDGAPASLWFASLQGKQWSAPTKISSGDNWFINWADFPSLVALSDGTLVAHWLQKSAPDSYAYDIRLVFSPDHGRHWSAPFSPHDDGTPTEHGFVTLLPQRDNTLSVVWLDGREARGDAETMQLRHASFDREGKKLTEQVIDSDTCTCCQTTATTLPDGIVVGYRDHAANEIRDIATLRWQRGSWSAPQIVHADNWEIPGCPVNGPALASFAQQLAVAWYTGGQNIPRVQVAFAGADGAFGAPLRVDTGRPLGRVALVMVSAHQAVVSWLERDGEQAALRLRRIDLEQQQLRAGPVHTLVHTGLGRSSGFPRLVIQGDNIIAAWTDTSEAKMPQVRSLAIPLAKL